MSIPVSELKLSQYKAFMTQKYLVKDLKELCEKWELKKSGKKEELRIRIYTHMKYTCVIPKIQSWIRMIFTKKYIQNKYDMLCRRPERTVSVESENSIIDLTKSIFERIRKYEKECIVDNDFLTMEPISDLPHYQKIMFRENGLIYGFDLSSFYQYVKKNNISLTTTKEIIKECQNPYTRQPFTGSLFKYIQKHIQICKILKFPIELGSEEHHTITETLTPLQQTFEYYDALSLSPQEKLYRRTADLFQYIDTFGYITDPQWFLQLDIHNVIRFVREVKDIWEYRAQITPETRNRICPNSHIITSQHNPFYSVYGVFLQNIYTSSPTDELGLINVKHVILTMCDKLTKNGITQDDKSLGIIFILMALTIVSHNASIAMPWFAYSAT
jgi:hypothetical protein